MSRIPFQMMRLAALSAIFAGSIASAQIVQTNKCPGCMAGGNGPGYPPPQVDVNALSNKVAGLELKLNALEAKFAALDAKETATDANVVKLLTHTHTVNTSFDFSSTVVSDIHQNTATVVIPIGSFGHPSGLTGAPKF